MLVSRTISYLHMASVYSITWFPLIMSAVSFYFAIQQPASFRRTILTILHLFCIGRLFTAGPEMLSLFPPIVVPFIIGLTLHTSSILLVDKHVAQLSAVSVRERLRNITFVWTNIRRRPHSPNHVDKTEIRIRVLFGVFRLLYFLILWIINRGINEVLNYVIISLRITIHDFAPSQQYLLPHFPITVQALSLRVIFSIQWMWSTYFGLTAGHTICATFFVSLLGWDQPADWPSLYGSIAEAYLLRRFWGVFWHRLHIAPFAAFTPFFLKTNNRQAIRSLWIFLLSAACHVVADWALLRRNTIKLQTRFFLYNWAVCFIETAVARAIPGTWLEVRRPGAAAVSLVQRCVGYIWVWFFFMCTVPAWEYHVVYNAVYDN